jgi:hypothetical protein
MARGRPGRQAVQLLIKRGRLDRFEAADLAALADALLARAALRLDVTATAALTMGDADGAYVAAYDAYRIAAEALLAAQGLRATSGGGAHLDSGLRQSYVRPVPAYPAQRAVL